MQTARSRSPADMHDTARAALPRGKAGGTRGHLVYEGDHLREPTLCPSCSEQLGGEPRENVRLPGSLPELQRFESGRLDLVAGAVRWSGCRNGGSRGPTGKKGWLNSSAS